MKMILEFELDDPEDCREAELAWRGSDLACAIDEAREALHQEIKRSCPETPEEIQFVAGLEHAADAITKALDGRGVLDIVTGE